MGEKFGQDQKKRDNSERDLHFLSPQPTTRDGLLPPLRRGPVPERSNPPDHVQIDTGSEDSKYHHRNAYRVLVKACGWSFRSRGDCSESAQPNDQPHRAERHDEGACALQDNEKKTR